MVQHYRDRWARQNDCLPLSTHWKSVVRPMQPKQKEPKGVPTQEQGFNHVKTTITWVLAYPDYSKNFESYTDASS